jgi:hypothetical protein
VIQSNCRCKCLHNRGVRVFDRGPETRAAEETEFIADAAGLCSAWTDEAPVPTRAKGAWQGLQGHDLLDSLLGSGISAETLCHSETSKAKTTFVNQVDRFIYPIDKV